MKKKRSIYEKKKKNLTYLIDLFGLSRLTPQATRHWDLLSPLWKIHSFFLTL